MRYLWSNVIILFILLFVQLHSINGTATIAAAIDVQQQQHDLTILPNNFTIQLTSTGSELVWTASDKRYVTIGGSLKVFRLSDGTILGYPREVPSKGKLVLKLTRKKQKLLSKILNTNKYQIQVWSSGKRLDTIIKFFNTSTIINLPPPSPAIQVDPTTRGNYTTTRILYNLSGFKYDSFPEPIEVLAEVTHPQPLPSNVKLPLIMFVHGRHQSCYEVGGFDNTFSWPCDEGFFPIPSYLGYRYIADILASNGYITVSISSNGINGQDYLMESEGGIAARSALIQYHLNLWSNWNTGSGPSWGRKFRNKVDMNNLVLVGHSRGGEGCHRAAIETASNSTQYKIRGIVSYGPTAFSGQVTPYIHSATILPTCDGDVFDLQGQAYTDRSRDIAYSETLRSAIIVIGANHNYFNTEWTPGIATAFSEDDWFDNEDPTCSSTTSKIRLTAQEQRTVGAAYTIAHIRFVVKQDLTMLQLLDGSPFKPAVVGRAEIVTHAVGGAANRLLYRPENSGSITGTRGMTGRECKGYSDGSSALPACTKEVSSYTPHWIQYNNLPTSQAIILKWSRTGATAWFTVPTGLRNLTGLDSIDVRIANDPTKTTGARVRILIQDRLGRQAYLRTSRASIGSWPPNTEGKRRIHARTLRGYLSAVTNVSISEIIRIALVSQTLSGLVWVLDITASQARIVQPAASFDIPVISVQSISNVTEGNGQQTVQLNIVTNKAIVSPSKIWYRRFDTGESYQLDLPLGSTGVIGQIPYSWYGDDVYGFYTENILGATIGAVKGVVVDDYIGFIHTVDNDPIPAITVNDQVVVEGQPLLWTFNLSVPTAGISLLCRIVPPTNNATELTSNDVPSKWLESVFVAVPPSVTPLSELDILIWVDFPYRIQSAQLIVPTRVRTNNTGTAGSQNATIVWSCISEDYKENTIAFFNVTVQGTVVLAQK